MRRVFLGGGRIQKVFSVSAKAPVQGGKGDAIGHVGEGAIGHENPRITALRGKVLRLLEIALDIHAAEQAAHHTMTDDGILPAARGVDRVAPAILKDAVFHQRPFDAGGAAAPARLDAVPLALFDQAMAEHRVRHMAGQIGGPVAAQDMAADDLRPGTIGQFDLVIDGSLQPTMLDPDIALARCGDPDHRIKIHAPLGIRTALRSQRRGIQIRDSQIPQRGPAAQDQKGSVFVGGRIGDVESPALDCG